MRRSSWSSFAGSCCLLAVALSLAAPGIARGQLEAGTVDSTSAGPRRDVFDVLRSVLGKGVSHPELAGEMAAGISWSILPVLGYNPIYGFNFGLGGTGSGRVGSSPATRISRLSASGSYSTTGQLQADLRGNLFLHENQTLLLIDSRYLDTSRPTYGLGPLGPEEQEYTLNYKLQRVYLTLLRRVDGPIYAGAGFHYDRYSDIEDVRAAAGDSTPYLDYTGSLRTKSQAAGISLNLLADARDNPVNPRAGYYLGATLNSFGKHLGSDQNWQEILLEFRAYPMVPGGSRHRLALWGMTWMTFGHVPYLSLPANGGDTYGKSARGYLQARIRAQNLGYFEGEYRFDLTRNGLLGGVVFLNTTTAAVPGSGVYGTANWAGGTGLRIKWNKKTDTNLAVDFGWGEGGSFGVFAGMGEAF